MLKRPGEGFYAHMCTCAYLCVLITVCVSLCGFVLPWVYFYVLMDDKSNNKLTVKIYPLSLITDSAFLQYPEEGNYFFSFF